MNKRLLFIYLLLISFFLTQNIKGANYYWVGGTGNWSQYNLHWATSSGGSTFHVQVPTNLDNVFFDANSGFTPGNNTVTIDQTIVYCKDMDWTGVTGTPKIQSLLYTNTIKIFGSLILHNAINFDYTANLSFEGTTFGNTITSSGITLPCRAVYFNGVGGSWTLQDSMTVKNIVYHLSGELYTNGKTMTVGAYQSKGSGVCLLSLGSSIFKIDPITLYDFTSHFHIEAINYSLNAGTSVIQYIGSNEGSMQLYANNTFIFNDIMTSKSSTFKFDMYAASIAKFRKAQFKGNAKLSASSGLYRPTFDSLIFFPGKTYVLSSTIGISTAGVLVANGTCSEPINIRSKYSGFSAYIEKPGASMAVSYVSARDITVNGGALINASNSYNLGNLVGWNISNPAARNLFWIGGTGVWSDPGHWSLSSGGSPNAGCPPFLSDNVFFDGNSGFTSGSSVTMDMPLGYCNTMDWTGALNIPEFKGNSSSILTIAGSLTFIPGLINNYQGDISFNATSSGNTITSANKIFISKNINFEGKGGSWTLLDSLSGTETTSVNLYAGTLNSNNNNINTGLFSCVNQLGIIGSAKILNLGNSVITITGKEQCCNLYGTNLTINAGNSTFYLSNKNRKYLYVGNYSLNHVVSTGGGELGILATGTGAYFHKLELLTGATIQGNNNYDSLILSAGNLYYFDANKTQTILNGTLVANGSCSKPINILSTSAGQPFILKKTTGNIWVDYVIINDNQAIGGASFVGNNSFATPEVTGWTINPVVSRNLYWVGGKGNWKEAAHWSTSSGGPGGACIPGPEDNVFFDINSFSSTGDTVMVDGLKVYCHHMDWSGSMFMPVFKVYTTIEVYGSLKMITGMKTIHRIGGSDFWKFSSNSNETITLAGQSLSFPDFSGETGEWNFEDDFVANTILLNSGTIRTNGHHVTTKISGIMCPGSSVNSDKAIYLGNSTVSITGGLYFNVPKLLFDAGTSSINFDYAPSGTINIFAPNEGYTFYNVSTTNDYYPIEINGNNKFNKLTLVGTATFNSSCTFDTLKLTPGRTYKFERDCTQTITENGFLDAMGTAGFPIELLSKQVGASTYISKASGKVCLDYLFLKDISAIGGAEFYAGGHGANVSNNNGWIFTDCPGDPDPDPTGVKEISIDSNIDIYPIPAQSSFFIEVSSKGDYQVMIMDGTGRKVQELEIHEMRNEINVSNFRKGIYNVLLIQGNTSIMKKIIIF